MSRRSVLINSERYGEVARMWEGVYIALDSTRTCEDLLKAFRQEVIYILYVIYFNFLSAFRNAKIHLDFWGEMLLKSFKWGRVGGVFTASGDKMSIIISKKESEKNWAKLKMEI